MRGGWGGGRGERGLDESCLEGVMYFGGECGDVFRGYLGEVRREKRERERESRKESEKGRFEGGRKEREKERRMEKKGLCFDM